MHAFISLWLHLHWTCELLLHLIYELALAFDSLDQLKIQEGSPTLHKPTFCPQ